MSAQNSNTENVSVSKRKKRTLEETVFDDEQEVHEDGDVEKASKKTKIVSKKLNVLGQLEASGGSTMSFQVRHR